MKLEKTIHLASLSLATTTGLLLGTTITVQAQDIFNNNFIQFEEDTIVEFEFIESHGAYQSTFGVIDLSSCQGSFGGMDLNSCQKTPLLIEEKASDWQENVARRSTYQDNAYIDKTNDFLGTPGNAVPQPMAEFKFEAGKRYVFYLESSFRGEPAGILYSSTAYNPGNNHHALFTDSVNDQTLQAVRRNVLENDVPMQEELVGLVNGGLMILWDDSGSVLVNDQQTDLDFNDFLVGVGGEWDCQ